MIILIIYTLHHNSDHYSLTFYSLGGLKNPVIMPTVVPIAVPPKHFKLLPPLKIDLQLKLLLGVSFI